MVGRRLTVELTAVQWKDLERYCAETNAQVAGRPYTPQEAARLALLNAITPKRNDGFWARLGSGGGSRTTMSD